MPVEIDILTLIISNTPEPLKTHLQLNVGKLGNFNALRVATEDYLRSRRIFETTSAGNSHEDDPMEVDILSRKGRGKVKSRKGKKGGKKGKESHAGKKVAENPKWNTTENRKWNTRALKVIVEIVENSVTKLPKVGTSINTSLQAKAGARASRNPTSQKSVNATQANMLKRHGHQTHLHNLQVCRK